MRLTDDFSFSLAGMSPDKNEENLITSSRKNVG